MQFGMAILRLKSGLDFSHVIDTGVTSDRMAVENERSTEVETPPSSTPDMLATVLPKEAKKKKKSDPSLLYRGPGGAMLDPAILADITVFHEKQPKVRVVV